MNAVFPLLHTRHEWVVDVATHRISRRFCADCAALPGDADIATVPLAGAESLLAQRASAAAPSSAR